MAFDEVLAGRVRERLRDRPGVTEKEMFGGPAFLTYGNMTVSVHEDDLIVRLGPQAAPAASDRPGARPFDLTGRPLRGWVLVAGEHLDDAQRSDQARILARIERAVLDGDLVATTNLAALAELVQTVWQGLSVRSELEATREQLVGVAEFTLTPVAQAIRSSR